MDISSLKKDSAAITAGQWVSDIPGLDKVRLRVRGLTSPVVTALRSRKERRVPRDQRDRDGSLKPEVAASLLCEVLHEAVLLDWDGFTLSSKPLGYDKEIALKYLTNPDFEAFADAVLWAARVVDKGDADAQEVLEKNS